MKMLFGTLAVLGLVLLPASALAQAGNGQDGDGQGESPPYECDDLFGECGTPEQSGGGCGCGGGSILVNNTDLGDTYQYADDYDDDGIEDPYDNCVRVTNIDQLDSDGDGVGDGCDNCLSAANFDQANLDGDALGDLCDDDMDGDGLANNVDNCSMVPNPIVGSMSAQADLDGNGIGDACDPDIDGDTLDNLADPCPLDPDPNASGDSCFPDTDGDGFGDFDPVHADVCPTIFDPDQLDTDDDGLGDACDPDMDDDGILNVMDNCLLVKNDGQKDEDRDGAGDACDDHFCFVVFGDADNCLDPEGPLNVYSVPLLATTGEPVRLRLFANRTNQAMRYTWTIVSAPDGSHARLANPAGTVTISTPYEYHYLADKVARFTADVPGEYTVKVSVETVWEDSISGQMNATQEFTTTITATGEAVTLAADGTADEGGCSGSSSTPGLLLGLLVLLGFGVLRRRTIFG